MNLENIVNSNMWWIFAVLSAVFAAAATAILAKIGIDGVNSNLATAIRTIVVLTIIFAVIFLGEAVTWKTILGSILLLAGTLIMVL